MDNNSEWYEQDQKRGKNLYNNHLTKIIISANDQQDDGDFDADDDNNNNNNNNDDNEFAIEGLQQLKDLFDNGFILDAEARQRAHDIGISSNTIDLWFPRENKADDHTNNDSSDNKDSNHTAEIVYRPPLHIPAELILMISCLMESVEDLFCLGMCCKRFYRLVLQNIRDPANRESVELLSKFLLEQMHIENTKLQTRDPKTRSSNQVDGVCISMFYCLPAFQGSVRIKGPEHGQRREFIVPKTVVGELIPASCWKYGFTKKVEGKENMDAFKAIVKKHGVKTRVCGFHHSQHHGGETTYYPSGQKKMEQTWIKGRLHGLSIRYFENGNKEVETTFKAGRPSGERIEYRSDGSVYRR